MNLHQKRTHPKFVENCFACRLGDGPSVAYCNSAGKGGDATAQKNWDRELDSYRAAVGEGMQPETTKTKDIQAAVKWSDKHQRAYSAEAARDLAIDKGLERSL